MNASIVAFALGFVGSAAGDLAAATVKFVSSFASPFSPWETSTMYFPGARTVWTSVRGPGFASSLSTIEPSLPVLFRSPFAFFSLPPFGFVGLLKRLLWRDFEFRLEQRAAGRP